MSCKQIKIRGLKAKASDGAHTASSSVQLPPSGISHQGFKCFTAWDHHNTVTYLRVGTWKGGRGGAEAEGMTSTMLPRSHLNHRAGAAPRLGREPNAGSAAPERGIFQQGGCSLQEESVVHPRAQNMRGGEPQGSTATMANGENNRATKCRPKSHLICLEKPGQPSGAVSSSTFFTFPQS